MPSRRAIKIREQREFMAGDEPQGAVFNLRELPTLCYPSPLSCQPWESGKSRSSSSSRESIDDHQIGANFLGGSRASRSHQEVNVERIGKIVVTALWVAAVQCVGLSSGRAQTSQPPAAMPANGSAPQPLPPGAGAQAPIRGVIAPPVSPASILKAEVHPIDLATALELAGVQNPELNVARMRILEAAAARQLAAAYFLPSINPGLNYDSHTGNLQQSSGNILGVNRSAFYIGAGANAVAAGTPTIPGVYEAANLGSGLFNYLASRQIVRQREFATIAVRNQMFLQVAWAYGELLRAEGRRAAQIQAREEARRIVKLTFDYARTGLGRVADANRAANQLARREADIMAAEAEVLTASANLCRLLNLDPSIRLHPTDASVVPQPIVPDPIPVAELIAVGLLNRPELAAQRAAIEAALLNLDGARILPFSPTTLIGFSAGGFAGGSNLVRPIFGGTSGRTDFDAILLWTIQNLGLGNLAMIRAADAQLKINQFQQVEILNMVRADVAEAYARAHARYAQIGTYEDAVRSGFLAYHEDLDRTIAMGAARLRDVLPIELLNSFDLLANARVEYVDAIVEYNRAQFAMYVALGQPPANTLAHPVPTEGVVPQNLPRRAAPAAAPAAAAGPAAFNPGRARPGSRAAAGAAQGSSTAPSGAAGANRPSRPIPPPRNAADVLNTAGR
jgi:outer membrane protein TolC